MNRFKNIAIISVMVGFAFTVNAQIKIISDEEATNDQFRNNVGSSFSTNSNLGHERTAWGETFYNPSAQNFKKENNINCETVIKQINLTKLNNRFEFKIPIQNLNAKDGLLYYSTENPKIKQKAENIYWGFILNISHKGINENIQVWINRNPSNTTYSSLYSSSINYKVNDNSWAVSSCEYPSCDIYGTNVIEITGFPKAYGGETTWIEWGKEKIHELPYFVDAINSITIMVGTQAKVQVKNAEIKISSIADKARLENYYSELSQSLKDENFNSVKEKVKRSISDGLSTETLVAFLAYSQLATEEYEDCKKTASLIIDYKGKHMEGAYGVRGFAKEALEDYNGALADFAKAGKDGKLHYDRLYAKINKLGGNGDDNKRNYNPNSKKAALTR